VSNKSLPLVGVSCGDPNGIGIEIILKTLSDKRNLKLFTPVLFCNDQLLSDQMKHLILNLILSS
jgi:4-hydroxythreonine-4-phosphate dehydrogenase